MIPLDAPVDLVVAAEFLYYAHGVIDRIVVVARLHVGDEQKFFRSRPRIGNGTCRPGGGLDRIIGRRFRWWRRGCLRRPLRECACRPRPEPGAKPDA